MGPLYMLYWGTLSGPLLVKKDTYKTNNIAPEIFAQLHLPVKCNRVTRDTGSARTATDLTRHRAPM